MRFSPFPSLETSRLLLRRMNHDDINDLFEMRNDPRMIEDTDSIIDETKEDTRAYIDKMNKGVDEGKWIIWAIEDKSSNKVIGSISVWNFNEKENSGELGYGIMPAFQGKGFMKEALFAVVEFSFKAMKLKFLDAYTEENNLSSNKLLEKCGFQEVDRVDDEGFYSNRVYHMVVYRLNNPLNI